MHLWWLWKYASQISEYRKYWWMAPELHSEIYHNVRTEAMLPRAIPNQWLCVAWTLKPAHSSNGQLWLEDSSAIFNLPRITLQAWTLPPSLPSFSLSFRRVRPVSWSHSFLAAPNALHIFPWMFLLVILLHF